MMAVISHEMTTKELLKVAADHSQKRISLSDMERQDLVNLLKVRGQEELDYGEELEFESVRLIKRVTGAVGVYFN